MNKPIRNAPRAYFQATECPNCGGHATSVYRKYTRHNGDKVENRECSYCEHLYNTVYDAEGALKKAPRRLKVA